MVDLPNLTIEDWNAFDLHFNGSIYHQLGSELRRIYIANRKKHERAHALIATETDARAALARRKKNRARAAFSRIFGNR